jgi:hypothetical protein
MSDENENLDVEDYTIPELMELLNIEKLEPSLIKEKTNTYIEKFNEENNMEMVNFFTQVKEKLLNAYGDETVESWYKNEYLSTDDPAFQNSKIPSRLNKIKEFNGAQNRERLSINQNKPIPFAQGEMNPTLQNAIKKIMNIDSTFRPNNVPALKSVPYSSEGIWNASHFTADLSDPLTRVLSLQLYSVQIPYTWYNISKGSNCFSYKEKVYSISPGNYTIDTLKAAIDNLTIPDITFNSDDYATTGKVSFKSASITVEKLVFFRTTGFHDDDTNCDGCVFGNYINATLGWIMGFREPCYEISLNHSVPAEAVVNLNGPKYLLLYLDEFNMNRINKGLVSIEDTETKLNLPSYYKPGNLSTSKKNDFKLTVVKPTCQNDEEVIGQECIKETYPVKTPFFTQDLPTTLTQAQQYTMNEIIKNRKNSPNVKLTGPNPNNIMGLIPVRPNGLRFGGMLVENANSLTFNTRNYFGPVDIERVEVKLLDDKGNLLQLNGSEWSFSIITTQLYQY